MSAGFTPGPWSVGRSCDNTPAVCVPCPNSSGFVVAHLNRLPKLGIVRGDMDANARLIAEAPALYALALCALDYFDSPDRSQGQVDTIVEALRTTLAAIDGEQVHSDPLPKQVGR